MKKLLSLLALLFLFGCSAEPSSSPSSAADPQPVPVIQNGRTEDMHPWEAVFYIPAGLPYTKMDIHVYILEDETWKERNVFPDNPLPDSASARLSFVQMEDAVSVMYDCNNQITTYSVPFEKKDIEGFANMYAWCQPEAEIVKDTEIPLYGHVRNEGNAIRAFTVEGFDTEPYFDEGIVFTAVIR